MRRVLALVFTLLYVVPAFSQAKRPFTFEDMMSLKRVGEPVPSPDGKWVLFSAVDVDLAANKKTPHIWIAPLAPAGGATGVSPVQARVGADASSAQAERSSAAPSSARERVLIADQDGDRPRWAPDGKRFAFISTKEGGSQVWIADFDVAAGKVTGVHRLTDIKTEAGGELWSPDGKNILFTSDVYPECDGETTAELACNAKKLKAVEESKVKALIFDRLLYRHWNAYKAGKRNHIFVVPMPPAVIAGQLPDLTPLDLTPGDYDAPVFSLGGQDLYALSPDGQELCYTSNHDKVEAISTNNDLWTVPVNWDASAKPADVLAKTKNITADNPSSDSNPLYSPDGKWIAYRAQQRPGDESDRFRLMLYDRNSGRKREVPTAFDLDNTWVGTIAWEPDSSRIYYTSENKGESPVIVVRIRNRFLEHDFELKAQPEIPEVITRGFNDDLTTTSDGTTLLFTRMSVQHPAEIYKIDGKTPPVPVTHVNDSLLSQVSMSPLESFWFKGAYGDKVQGFLVKPPNFDASKKYPVKFILHGGPEVPEGDEWSYRWNAELFAASGYVVIMINFHGSPGYGQKFIDAINGDWGGAPFEDLMKGLDYAEKTYPFIDKDRECALGASYGGYMANWILGHTDRFKCIVAHDGMFNTTSAWGTTEELWFNDWEFKGTPYTNRALYDKWSPHLSATNFKTPTLVVHGQLDYRLDVSEGFQLFTTLQRLGVPSKMLYFPDEGHWVLKPQNSQLWYKTVNDWVDQFTKK
ncbi:MAG: S9 family peptidase [Acidobacteria bacterium]|nr:MAG: S9 family peptidase [Acidobacteriota bacterium]